MSILSDKLRVLRTNREWTQLEIADKLSITESAHQKWEVGKNMPSLEDHKRLSDVFGISTAILMDDKIDVPEYWYLDTIPSDYYAPGESDHAVIDADLKREGRLHRFINPAGVPYSAIYVGSYELFSCVREHEQAMINCWNE